MKNILVVVGLFFSTFLVAEEVLYCIPELSTGFTYENNTFKTIRFKNDRFTVKVYGDFEKIDIGIYSRVPCGGFGEGVRVCTSSNASTTTFKYNPTNNRFLLTQIGQFGYLDYPSNDGKYDTDSLQAGKCEKF